MSLFDRFRRSEERATVHPNGAIPVSSDSFRDLVGRIWGDVSIGNVSVTVDTALSVPAFGAAVGFLSRTLASVPLHLYDRKADGHKRADGSLADILHDAPNDETSSYEWRRALWEQVFTTGRAFTFIERNTARDKIINLWLLDPGKVTVKLVDGRKVYVYKENRKAPTKFKASEILDVAFMLRPGGVRHRGPVSTNKDVLKLAIAATRWGARFFENGGVPPYTITGDFETAKTIERAGKDFDDAIKKAAAEGRHALVLPRGLEAKKLGLDLEEMQMVELKRFLIEEIARMFSMPPTFLQDLTHGTFSNTEQQDLHFVKHTLRPWVEQFEQELNLKLFGRGNRGQFAEHNVDGLLRGDFVARMNGYSQGVQNAVLLPNEARKRENLPPIKGGDEPYMQGAMAPITNLGNQDEGSDDA